MGKKIIYTLLLFFSIATSKEVFLYKPSPCHVIQVMTEQDYTLYVHLIRKMKSLCIQRIVREKILVPSHIKEIRIFVNNKLWKKYRIN